MLLDNYQNFIHISRYARYMEKEKRRETWKETVNRWYDFYKDDLGHYDDPESIYEAVLNMDVMPSMRSLMTAGKTLAQENVASYNCSYLEINRVEAFAEALFILMCGTGVGFSVERRCVQVLPIIPEKIKKVDYYTLVVEDSRIGWAKAFNEMITSAYKGLIYQYDVSKIRPAGARLKTFGGRASGPEPLVNLFKFTEQLFMKARGRRLTSIECHDLLCQVASTVVVGGVRRSAMISLSNMSDQRMAHAKSGDWFNQNANRSYANNSIAYTEKPEMGSFMQEWLYLYESKSGERGIFNRVAAAKKCEEINRDSDYAFGTNPCGEIILRDRQFCNLSEAIIRKDDTYEDIERKIRIATVIGTVQSKYTDFNFIDKKVGRKL